MVFTLLNTRYGSLKRGKSALKHGYMYIFLTLGDGFDDIGIQGRPLTSVEVVPCLRSLSIARAYMHSSWKHV